MRTVTSNEIFRERARKAAEARWGKERHYKRLRAANPKLSEAQAITRAINENPRKARQRQIRLRLEALDGRRAQHAAAESGRLHHGCG